MQNSVLDTPMCDISDIFWQLESAQLDHIEAPDACVKDVFTDVIYDISGVYGSAHSRCKKYNEDITICLGELREDGVTCAVGGELWESSILLSCFMMFHIDKWCTKNVLELGSGVSIPGLLMCSLKMMRLEELCNGAKSESTVFLTDYDHEVLENLSNNCHMHISSEFGAASMEIRGVEVVSEGTYSLGHTPCLTVRICQLDWTQWKQDTTHSKSQRGEGSLFPCQVIIGSELVYTPDLSCVADVIV